MTENEKEASCEASFQLKLSGSYDLGVVTL